MSEKELEPKSQYAKVLRKSPESPPDWSDPTPKMLETPEFNALWELMKGWDINVPGVDGEGLYTGTTGNHIRAILDALSKVAIVMRKSDAKKIFDALKNSNYFFHHRDQMNSHIHLTQTESSPLASKVMIEYRRMEAYLVGLGPQDFLNPSILSGTVLDLDLRETPGEYGDADLHLL